MNKISNMYTRALCNHLSSFIGSAQPLNCDIVIYQRMLIYNIYPYVFYKLNEQSPVKASNGHELMFARYRIQRSILNKRLPSQSSTLYDTHIKRAFKHIIESNNLSTYAFEDAYLQTINKYDIYNFNDINKRMHALQLDTAEKILLYRADVDIIDDLKILITNDIQSLSQ